VELDTLIAAKDEIRQQLSTYKGLFDIQDNLSDGKDEFQLNLKPEAKLCCAYRKKVALA